MFPDVSRFRCLSPRGQEPRHLWGDSLSEHFAFFFYDCIRLQHNMYHYQTNAWTRTIVVLCDPHVKGAHERVVLNNGGYVTFGSLFVFISFTRLIWCCISFFFVQNQKLALEARYLLCTTVALGQHPGHFQTWRLARTLLSRTHGLSGAGGICHQLCVQIHLMVLICQLSVVLFNLFNNDCVCAT